MKVLIATEKPFAAAATEAMCQIITNAGLEVELLEKYTDRSQLLKAVAEADALIIRSDKVDAEVIAAAPKLKVVVRAGAGYDNVDLAAATAANVVVENTPGQNANAVAELVFCLALMAVRNHLDGTSGTELLGKTLGVHAFGAVGRNVARIAQGFDMNVSALDPYCDDAVILQQHVTPVHSVEELYSGNKFVSIHIPATAETRASIGYDLITKLPKGGVLINTARKEVINEEGLQKALRDRTDLKYVADVKPDNAEELIAEFGNRVLFTPKKMGAQTAEANMNAGLAAARQVVALLVDGKVMYKVNR